MKHNIPSIGGDRLSKAANRSVGPPFPASHSAIPAAIMASYANAANVEMLSGPAWY